MGKYEGLDDKLKKAIYARDNYRCRWCGSTNRMAYDVHHIRYRRGPSDDVIENLITLCRKCHNYVHDSYRIPKETAQQILWWLASDEGRGTTGIARFRQLGIAPELRKGRLRCATTDATIPPLNTTSMCRCGHLRMKHYGRGGRCKAPECSCLTPDLSSTPA